MGFDFKLVLVFLMLGVILTSIRLLLTFKTSSVRLFSLFQLCLFGAIASAIISLNNQGFFIEPIENIAALLFYVFIIAIPPSLYNFIGSAQFKDFECHSKIFILPFVVFGINLISFFYLTFGESQEEELYIIIENVMNYTNFISYLFIFPIITLYYIIKVSGIFIQIKSKKQLITSNEFSIIPSVFLVGTYIVFVALFFISQIVKENWIINYCFYGTILLLISLSYIITFQLFRKNKLLAVKNELIEDFSYFYQIEEGLNQFIILDKNYLNPRLTLNDCAKGIKSNEKYLSNYLNKVMNMNFNTYINNLRIEEAKGLLLSTDSDRYTIEAIAKMAGFNSKSSFNAVFKKHVDMTPSEFKSKNK